MDAFSVLKAAVAEMECLLTMVKNDTCGSYIGVKEVLEQNCPTLCISTCNNHAHD